MIKSSGGNKREAPRRNFTLLDAMIAISAIAAELWMIRSLDLGIKWEFHSRIWTEPEFFFHSWMIDQFIGEVFAISVTCALSLTMVALAFRLRPPRPTRRRLAGQPGAAALLAAVAAWLTTIPWVFQKLFMPDEPNYNEHFGLNLGLPAVLAGVGVASRWGLLILARRWHGEPGWIDRLGRLIGVSWMALGLWAIWLRMVC